MSKSPSVQEFKLSVDPGPASPRLTVEDLTAQGEPRTLTRSVSFPLFLAVDYAPDSHAELVVRLATPDEPFDPEVTRDGNVLKVETALSDVHFGTQDDSRYIVRLTNRSRYYVAEDVHVDAELKTPAQAIGILPDGNPMLSLEPEAQHVDCIGPGKSVNVVFMAVSRGPKPDLYPVKITLKYRLLYWDGRTARAVSEQVLAVQSDDVSFDSREMTSAVRTSPLSQSRSHAMPEATSTVTQTSTLFPSSREGRTRHLHPIHLHIPLPGGGQIELSYRLTKHGRRDPGHAPGSYGVNPETHAIESYFSTEDTAALEVSLHNDSAHELKHLRLRDVRLIPVHDGDGEGEGRPDEGRMMKLPDGNLLFEVTPDGLYYGHINPGQRETKYLTLISRGVAPGRYVVHMDACYDIEQCEVPVDLGIEVNPD